MKNFDMLVHRKAAPVFFGLRRKIKAFSARQNLGSLKPAVQDIQKTCDPNLENHNPKS